MTSVELTSTSDFALYCQRIGSAFCPYLIPSMENKSLYSIEIDLTNIDERLMSAYVYIWALKYTNIFKKMRLPCVQNECILLCINVIFIFPNTISGKEENYLSWAHWILKTQFSIDGIMFGKFWKNEETYSRDKRLIYPPEHNFISIRNVIIDKDFNLLSSEQTKIIEDLKKSISNPNCNNYDNYDIENMSQDEIIEVFEKAKKKSSVFLK